MYRRGPLDTSLGEKKTAWLWGPNSASAPLGPCNCRPAFHPVDPASNADEFGHQISMIRTIRITWIIKCEWKTMTHEWILKKFNISHWSNCRGSIEIHCSHFISNKLSPCFQGIPMPWTPQIASPPVPPESTGPSPRRSGQVQRHPGCQNRSWTAPVTDDSDDGRNCLGIFWWTKETGTRGKGKITLLLQFHGAKCRTNQ